MVADRGAAGCSAIRLKAPALIPPATYLAFATHAEVDGAAVPAALARATRRQLDYLVGRLAAGRALIRLTSHAPEIGRGADGAPVWPSGITGAISHADGRAVALVVNAARHAGLGVDRETIITHPDEIAPLVLNQGEAAIVPPDGLYLTVVFSAKESLFKALYPRVRHIFGFDAARLVTLDSASGTLRLRQPLGPWPKGAEFPFGWHVMGGQVLTTLAAPYALSVAPPST